MLRVGSGWVLLLCGAVFSLSADAREQTELGVRVNALHANGDIYGAGLHLRHLLRDNFFVAATLDKQNYVAERLPDPFRQPIRPIPSVQSTVAGVNVGRLHHMGDTRLMWFWSMGLAAGFPRASHSGPGDVRLEAKTEVHLRTAVGIETLMSAQWSLTAAVRVERHYVNLDYEDSASEQRATVSSLTPGGIYLSLGYRF